jgi:hypothetical protein
MYSLLQKDFRFLSIFAFIKDCFVRFPSTDLKNKNYRQITAKYCLHNEEIQFSNKEIVPFDNFKRSKYYALFLKYINRWFIYLKKLIN